MKPKTTLSKKTNNIKSDKNDNDDQPSKFVSLKSFLKTKPSRKQTLIIFAVIFGLIGLLALLFRVLDSRKADPNLETIVHQEIVIEPVGIVTEASKLTGVQVEPIFNKRPVTGIMIENSIDARPQSGLIDAGVVFEAIAEGGITRFLALYQVGQPDYIGPVRSARPYYVQWAASFDAAYTHSGGSGEALNLIRNLGLKDLDHGNNPSYFDRVSNRYAPHNVYTSMSRLDNLRDAKGYTEPSDFEEFARIEQEEDSEDTAVKTEKPAKVNEKASKIDFNISGPLYNTSYIYDAATNTYARSMAGQKHFDERTEKQIKPSVVIALISPHGYHSDGVHTTYKTIGSGDLIVFQNGEVIKGTWTKSGNKSPLKFTTTDKKALALQPGQTWITPIPSGRTSYTP